MEVGIGAYIGIAILAFACEVIDSSLGMMYGTILSPVLIIIGFNPLIVVPSILLSQAVGGFVAAVFHHQLGNVYFARKSADSKAVLIITAFGIIGVAIALAVALNIPSWVVTVYIGVLVIAMGAIILSKRKFSFSWKRLSVVGLISSFNKAMSGGGFGPVVATGQIISGVKSKNAVGITTLSEAPICIASFIGYLLFHPGFTWNLAIALLVGAGVAGTLGPYITKYLPSSRLRTIVGILAVVLGIWTLVVKGKP
jgi:uncharacterized membrane protein YfcA